MRRRTLALGATALIVLTLMCAALTLRGWASQSSALVMGGARDVNIVQRGVSRMHLTYRLPDGQTTHNLREFLTQRGWRRISMPNSERLTLSYVRSGWPRAIREILVVTIDPLDREVVDLQFARCVVSRWVGCF